MNEPTLHPNLAKLAAAYDEILERLSRGQVSTAAARSEIAQLEARDDQGVRWNIDPDSGEWVRKTALGDFEYDAAPPTFGYMTPDAFDYTQDPQAFNPSDRLQMAPVTDHLEQGPSSLTGATRTRKPVVGRPAPSATVSRVLAASTRAKVAVAVALLVCLALVMYACAGETPTNTVPPKPATSKSGHPAKGPGAHSKHKHPRPGTRH